MEYNKVTKQKIQQGSGIMKMTGQSAVLLYLERISMSWMHGGSLQETKT